MNIFPSGPIALGTLATATLSGVRRGPKGLEARYSLTPKNEVAFVDTMGGLREYLGWSYAPLSGTWASFVVPEERDEIELVVGMDASFGRALVGAYRDLRLPSTSVVPDFTVRALALGYLVKAGVSDG